MTLSKWLYILVVAVVSYGAPSSSAIAGSIAPVTLNLDATLHGFNTPETLSLPAGEYQVDIIGMAGGGLFDAWNAWGTTTCTEASGCPRTAPSTFLGFLTGMRILSSSIGSVTIEGVVLDPTLTPPPVGSWFVEGVGTQIENGLVYPDELAALQNAQSISFVLTADDSVGFSTTDDNLGDNLGGLSVRITSVPEPSASILVAAIGLGLARRRRSLLAFGHHRV